jgi:DNA mismatch endonuclease (patch repair protein)
MAVFVDGCFWHGCPEHGVLPKNNGEWWREKLSANSDRDRRKDDGLLEIGWLPVHLWEHEPVEAMVARVVDLWQERTGRTAPAVVR